MTDSIQVLYNKLCKENNISRSINKVFMIFLLFFLLAFGITVGISLKDSRDIFNTIEYIETLEEGEEIDITKIDTGPGAEVYILIFGIICIIAIFLYIYSYKKVKQDGVYRENVLAPLVKESIEGIQYTFNTGFTEEYYSNMGFTLGDTYKAKEYIKIPFKNSYIEITSIEIKNRDNDDTTTIFDGYVSELSISKTLEKKVQILYNPFNLIKYNNRVYIDNGRFDEKYNLLCEDKYLAVRLFTSDILFKIMELYNKYKIIVNINIIGSKIYMQTRKEVGINDYMMFKFTDVERKIQDLEFIKEISEILYEMIESLEV